MFCRLFVSFYFYMLKEMQPADIVLYAHDILFQNMNGISWFAPVRGFEIRACFSCPTRLPDDRLSSISLIYEMLSCSASPSGWITKSPSWGRRARPKWAHAECVQVRPPVVAALDSAELHQCCAGRHQLSILPQGQELDVGSSCLGHVSLFGLKRLETWTFAPI